MRSAIPVLLIGLTATAAAAVETHIPARPTAPPPIDTAPEASSPADPLALARAHLERGELDDVLLVLDSAEFPRSRAKAVAETLADAASDALDQRDDILSLALAHASLVHDPNEPLALATAARASLNLQQFAPAKQYIRRFVALRPRSPMAKLLSAEEAYVDREWNRTLSHLRGLKTDGFNDLDALRVEELMHHSEEELAERRAERQIRTATPKPARYTPRGTKSHFRQHVNPNPPRLIRRSSCGR